MERAEEVAGTNDDGDNDDEVVEGGEAEDEADVDETHDNGYDDVKTPSQRKRGRTSEEVNMEGLIIDDEMYLLDRAQGIVYSSSMGKLVKVDMSCTPPLLHSLLYCCRDPELLTPMSVPEMRIAF